MFRAVILMVVLTGCATDMTYETERVWCVGACVIEHTKTQRHSETQPKSQESDK